jgi:hypothetical protein
VSVGVELPALLDGVVGGGVDGVEVRDELLVRVVQLGAAGVADQHPADAMFSAHRRQPGQWAASRS